MHINRSAYGGHSCRHGLIHRKPDDFPRGRPVFCYPTACRYCHDGSKIFAAKVASSTAMAIAASVLLSCWNYCLAYDVMDAAAMSSMVLVEVGAASLRKSAMILCAFAG